MYIRVGGADRTAVVSGDVNTLQRRDWKMRLNYLKKYLRERKEYERNDVMNQFSTTKLTKVKIKVALQQFMKAQGGGVEV